MRRIDREEGSRLSPFLYFFIFSHFLTFFAESRAHFEIGEVEGGSKLLLKKLLNTLFTLFGRDKR